MENRELQQQNEKILKDLQSCFQKYKKDISEKSQLTFKHEYGHVEAALELNFHFSFIALFDKKSKKYPLFYLKNDEIKYGAVINPKNPSSLGVAFFSQISQIVMTGKKLLLVVSFRIYF